MNKIEQMHFEAIEKSEVNINPSDDDNMWITDKNVAAKKSAEITEQIAIEFAKFCLNKAKDLDTHTVYHRIDNIFQEFLKTKQ